MKKIRLEYEDKVAIISLNNPPQNRLEIELGAELSTMLCEIRQRGSRALVLRADGEDFSYGGYFPAWIGRTSAEMHEGITQTLKMWNSLEQLPIPVIAAVQGACWGGGFELVLRCDMILATPNATFNHPEKTLAITTLMGGVYRFASRAGRNIAAELAFTSEPIDAARMHQYGVINHIVQQEHLLEETMKLAHSLANGPTLAHAAHKALLHLWAQGGVQAADDALADLSAPLFETEDVAAALKSAADAFEKGVPRPILKFKGK